MLIHQLDPAKLHSAYGVQCQGVDPWQGVAVAPFYSAWCVVKPGQVAKAHKHQEHETFFVAQGRGLMRVDDETREVVAGDVVFMEPFSTHELTNTGDEDLLFLDVCWEDMAEAAAKNAAAVEAGAGTRPAGVLITATPPTPNGDLHVGHLAGPYLCADFHARYLALRGVAAHYLTGIDDHQSFVVTKARRVDATPEEVVRQCGEAMSETWRRAHIALDHVARPKASPYHAAMTRELFSRLYEQGALVAREAPTLYCEPCGRYLFEAHVVGTCPHCGEGSCGNACEACGRPNDCVDLVDPTCQKCGTPPVVKTQRRIFFPLAPFTERLERFFAAVDMNPHLRALCEQMLADGLPDIAVSQETEWGIPVPVPGFEGQRIYVWLEMASGYLAATQELADQLGRGEGWQDFWRADDRRVVQFFGFDNGHYHAVLFPALFMAYDPEIRLPSAFVTNEFYRYEGSKFSTSRNHAMWGKELFDRVPVDAARFYLAYDCPETEQTSFTLAALQATVERELVGAWEPWLRELGTKVRDAFADALPGTGAWTAEHQRFYQTLLRLTADAASAYEAATFSPQRASRVLCELVRSARRFAKAEEHWRRVPRYFEEWRTAVALEALAAKTLALLACPIMPDFAGELWRALGFADTPVAAGWQDHPEFVPSGRSLAGLDRAWFSR